MQLVQMKCVACRGGEPTLIDSEIVELHPQVPFWPVIEKDGIKRIERTFKFENFSEALTFTNKVGEVAESEGHHPAILTEWGRVTVTWWTHKIKGLHRNDFIMAAKTDWTYLGQVSEPHSA
jgi:4a-hydroxytetrahydrobiopterin dehydratase